MSRLDSLMEDIGLPTMREYLGGSIIYRADQAADVTVTAVSVTPEKRAETDGDADTRRRRTIRTVLVMLCDIADPIEHALVQIPATTGDWWTIDEVEMAGSHARLTVVRTGAVEKSTQGYRRNRT